MSHHGALAIILVLLSARCLLTSEELQAAELQAGAAAVDVTPRFEGRPVDPHKPGYLPGQKFFDTGIDGLFDYEEPGAFGADGKPGRAGIDDDGNGLVDDCDRKRCKEYLAKGSDDLRDPNHDNYHWRKNRSGTEGDGIFQFMPLAGFAPYYPVFYPARVAAGVHDPLWARAIAVRGSNGETTVLISVDSPGIVWKNINPARRRLAKEFHVPVGNIVVSATHDHAAPDGSGYWSTILPGKNHAYMMQLRQWIYQAGAEALRSMRPALMKSITTTHVSCFDLKTQKFKKDPDCHLPMNGDEFHEPGADFDIPVIQTDRRDPIVRNTRIVAAQFVATESTKTIATFVNWHNHPDTLMGDNMLVSSDFPHYLREMMETRLGGISVYFSGTVGCQIGAVRGMGAPHWNQDMTRGTPSGRDPEHHQDSTDIIGVDVWEAVRSIGYEIANEAVIALDAAPLSGPEVPVAVDTRRLETRVDNALHVLATGSVWTEIVEPEDRMKKDLWRCRGRWGCVPSDVSVLQIGDLGMITAPGEMDPSYLYGRVASVGHYGKKGDTHYPAMEGLDPYIPGIHHAVLGQANNYLSYTVHKQDNHGWWNFKHPDHYEELVTVSKNFGDDFANLMASMLKAPVHYFSSRRIP